MDFFELEMPFRLLTDGMNFLSPIEMYDLLYGDEDEHVIEQPEPKRINRVPRTFRTRTDLFHQFSEDEFVKRFRLNKATVIRLFHDIEKDITPKTMRNNAVEPINKLLATLRFYATGALMSTISDFGGISVTSARDFMAQTTFAIAKLLTKYVTLPEDLEEVKRKFYEKAKFPNVIMTIDCTHVRIISPGCGGTETFRNTKGYFSQIVQTLCDSDLRVCQCVADWPGSTHDQEVFTKSILRYRFEKGEFGNGLLLGDNSYENQPYLVTPLLKCKTNAEKLYNESFFRTRAVVEECFNVIRKRFPVLSVGLRCSSKLSIAVIQAAVVMHNLGLEDPLPEAEIDIEKYEDAKIEVERYSVGDDGMQKKLVENHFTSLE